MISIHLINTSSILIFSKLFIKLFTLKWNPCLEGLDAPSKSQTQLTNLSFFLFLFYGVWALLPEVFCLLVHSLASFPSIIPTAYMEVFTKVVHLLINPLCLWFSLSILSASNFLSIASVKMTPKCHSRSVPLSSGLVFLNVYLISTWLF